MWRGDTQAALLSPESSHSALSSKSRPCRPEGRAPDLATGRRTGGLLSRRECRPVPRDGGLGPCLGTRCFEGDAADGREALCFNKGQRTRLESYFTALSLKEAGGRLCNRFSREQEVGNVREADWVRTGWGRLSLQCSLDPGNTRLLGEGRAEDPGGGPLGKPLQPQLTSACSRGGRGQRPREGVAATLVPWSPRGAQRGTRRLSDSSVLGQGRPKSPIQQHLQRCGN